MAIRTGPYTNRNLAIRTVIDIISAGYYWYATEKIKCSGYFFSYRGFGTLCIFIAKCVLRKVSVACTVMVVIETRCLSSHYTDGVWTMQGTMDGVAEQCRALDNHHLILFWFHTLRFTPYEFNLQVFVNCMYVAIAVQLNRLMYNMHVRTVTT